MMGMVAAVVLAILALVASYAMFGERHTLLESGTLTDGIVVGIDTGVKGLKSVEVEFADANGRRIVGRDLNKTMWFAANDVGDRVNIYYASDSLHQPIPDILVERGLWIWFEPFFLLFGGVLLLVLGIFLFRNPGDT
ncbi:hypothetical protein N8198_06905 [Gammaproteobacteria bacterium]|nr:hypothetical protein [Gammaproteobacteria bacterium]